MVTVVRFLLASVLFAASASAFMPVRSPASILRVSATTPRALPPDALLLAEETLKCKPIMPFK